MSGMELWELTAREACRDTLAQYTHAGDRYRLDEYAAAFCEDGVLEIRGSEPARGRAAIIETITGRVPADRPPGTASGSGVRASDSAGARASASGSESGSGVKRIVRHNVTNVRFESLTPDEATVASYFTVFTEIGLDHMGRYRDRMVPVGDRWLIAHRFVSTDWRAPESTFSPRS